MKKIALLSLWILGASPLFAKAINPSSVAVVYNSAVPDSKKLAEIYQKARDIPTENLVGLDMPVVPDISRADYISKIQNPLIEEFDKRSWWRRARDVNGIVMPLNNDIRVVVLMRGVPLRIRASPVPAGFKVNPGDPVGGRNEASVYSELEMFGTVGMPLEGALRNPYFQSEKPIAESGLPYLILTARIDAASTATCERMIKDAVEAEKTGLWGKAYVDIANKFPMGDQWLSAIVTKNRATGIPTVVDRFNDTFPMNYPMADAAEYYGWYDGDVSGPFLNAKFKFRKGAVAMHLHSFSAEQLSDPTKNWSAGLLEKGAAVTVGNVFEPYLQMTHYFEILHDRLLKGHTWVEACWMAMPVSSWQGVVLGDPLYRPFLHLDGSGEMGPGDNDYRALRAATLKWPDDAEQRQKQLIAASERLDSGIIAEAAGLEAVEEGKTAEAAVWFHSAQGHYVSSVDKLRQDFNLISMDRAAGHKDKAIGALRALPGRYGMIPETVAAKGWLDILDPQAPPMANPNQHK